MKAFSTDGLPKSASIALIALLVVLLAAGCGSTPTPAPTDTPLPPRPTPTAAPRFTPTPPPTAETEPAPAPAKGAFEPLPAADCEALAAAVEKILGVKPVSSEAAFADYITGQTGTGCDAVATGTGADFGEFPAVASKLQEMLEAQGWTQDVQYQADGPAGTAMGFHKGDGLCLLSVNWQPSEDADCPDDQPLATCDLKPEQKLFTIGLNCAAAAG